eukprot:TRINITY_DN8014_c0_g1_i1.p1 TRINITY_DN8014_c0_g1~~TRINITY_DN8014_c0_g1_i1.p1  ORF type:complete len:418 (-),score=47.17 TRINITY_DN8014_c0_g1_i1:102-1334(-)
MTTSMPDPNEDVEKLCVDDGSQMQVAPIGAPPNFWADVAAASAWQVYLTMTYALHYADQARQRAKMNLQGNSAMEMGNPCDAELPPLGSPLKKVDELNRSAIVKAWAQSGGEPFPFLHVAEQLRVLYASFVPLRQEQLRRQPFAAAAMQAVSELLDSNVTVHSLRTSIYENGTPRGIMPWEATLPEMQKKLLPWPETHHFTVLASRLLLHLHLAPRAFSKATRCQRMQELVDWTGFDPGAVLSTMKRQGAPWRADDLTIPKFVAWYADSQLMKNMLRYKGIIEGMPARMKRKPEHRSHSSSISDTPVTSSNSPSHELREVKRELKELACSITEDDSGSCSDTRATFPGSCRSKRQRRRYDINAVQAMLGLGQDAFVSGDRSDPTAEVNEAKQAKDDSDETVCPAEGGRSE